MNKEIKIVVINLPSSFERREYVSRRLAELGLTYTLFSAVNGRENTDPDLALYDDRKRLFEKGHSLTLGERGCFASHRGVWQLSVKEKANILVLEDDVELSADLPSILHECSALLDDYHYIRLGRGTAKHSLKFLPKWKVERDVDEQHRLVKYLRGPSCAHAYIITPVAAERFLSHSKKWWWPVDDYMDMEYLNGQCNYGIEPPLVNQRGVASDIGGVKKPKRKIATRIRKEYFRYLNIMRRNLFNLSYFLNKR
ncbi:glycosyltransferase family 25 protein [Zobellella iuensis]|uniref:Glycosyltransferase family 25 protein n=1 Tax=Zobellella iuensis TaxID=2803811 RepID=A0ABS1QNE9_9GAMM|nr:glycosyltransferase family 25 protein [Zobellella iuensis]MBL1376132.1 glycosyltransferase family 25 protein [Zobellella iuensis]